MAKWLGVITLQTDPQMSAPSSAHCLSEMWEARESMMSSSSCWLSNRSVGSLETCTDDQNYMKPDSQEDQGGQMSPLGAPPAQA